MGNAWAEMRDPQSVTWFYGYIREILTDILEKKFSKQKIDQNSWKCKKKPCSNVIRSIINNLKLFVEEFDIYIWFAILDIIILCRLYLYTHYEASWKTYFSKYQ